MRKEAFLAVMFLSISVSILATVPTDTTHSNKKTKTGWTFGAVPVVAYDSDIGFKYGGLVNFYNYGNGSRYPKYDHSIYLEWSRTTKGSGINQITYDSEQLIPGIRVSGEISYLTEKALDFYGYNGYKTFYNSLYEDDSQPDSIYKSRLFYRQDRKLLRLRADFQGKLGHKNLKWIGGLAHYNVQLDTVDLDKLNEGKEEADKLPASGGGLYGLYNSSSTLPTEFYDGGNSTFLKAGIVYDSRDNEPNPMHGIWTGLTFFIDPGFMGESPAYGRYSFTHRQYFTLLPARLSFAYRIIYQGKLFGDLPSYMLPFILKTGRYTDSDGFGGAKTIRGVLRNRVVGNDMTLGNFELRWKFVQTVVLNQNVYLALSAFTDMGMVTRDFLVNTTNDDALYFPDKKEGIHQSVGAGFRIALNENFIIAVDYGIALDERDGDNGLYVNLDWMF